MIGTIAKENTQLQKSQGGVAIGVLMSVSASGEPMVAFANAPDEQVRARSVVVLSIADVGSQVALAFEAESLDMPIVLGKIIAPRSENAEATGKLTAIVDDDMLTLKAKKQVVLQCGDASITLTQAGKVIIRGKYVISQSSGANKLRGATVQIN